jgi:NADPH2:quinone reductase
VVVGFTGGSIPEVKVNRLLLNNISVVGAGWGAFVLKKPDVIRAHGEEIDKLIGQGSVRPLIGQRFPLEQAADALKLLDSRQALAKVVLDVRSCVVRRPVSRGGRRRGSRRPSRG